MRSAWSFVILLFALVALASPSAGALVRASQFNGKVAAVAQNVGGGILKLPCAAQGGKRVLPCHPDLGVLFARIEVEPRQTGMWRDLRNDLPRSSLPGVPDLPPPRLG